MDVVSIFTIVLLIAASILCISLVIYLNRITKAILKIEDNIEHLTSEFNPLISSFMQLTDKMNVITDEVKEQVSNSKEIVAKIKYRVEEILDLEEKIREGFEGSALDLIKNITAITNGVSAFWNAYKKNKIK